MNSTKKIKMAFVSAVTACSGEVKVAMSLEQLSQQICSALLGV